MIDADDLDDLRQRKRRYRGPAVSKEPIPPQLRQQLLVRDRRLLAPLCHDCEVFEILEELPKLSDRQHDAGLLPGIVTDVLKVEALEIHPGMTSYPISGRDIPYCHLGRGRLSGMKSSAIVSMDETGSLVLPEEVRREAGLEPGVPLRISSRNGRVEIEPAPREMRIFPKGKLWVAEPVEPGEPLTAEMVRRTQNWIRDRALED